MVKSTSLEFISDSLNCRQDRLQGPSICTVVDMIESEGGFFQANVDELEEIFPICPII